MNKTKKEIAEELLLRGIQNHGQTIEKTIKAWQKVFDFIKLPVVVSFQKIDGKEYFFFKGDNKEDIQIAVEFKSKLQEDLRRLYNFYDEIKKIEEYLEKYSNSNEKIKKG